jgi:porin
MTDPPLHFARKCLGRAAARGLSLPALVLAGALSAPVCVAHAESLSNAAATSAAAARAALPENVEPSISSSIPAFRDLKRALLARGVNFELSYIHDTFGNGSGGVQQGATYNSALYMLVDADLAKLAGVSGATFRVNAFQFQGVGLSIRNVYNYSTISSIEPRPTTRLVELWLEQKLFSYPSDRRRS